MPAVTRLGDCTTCDCQAVTASPNVFADKIAIHRLEDLDCCGSCNAGDKPIVAASPTTYANSKAVARIGDPDSCSGNMACGSPTTFADD